MSLEQLQESQIITDGNKAESDNSCKLYIVISQTGTVLSRFLKIVTRKKYNHASISVENDLNIMYSFGRINPYNPVWGGFVKESPKSGTFARFPKTEVVVLSVNISKEQRENIKIYLESMYIKRKEYHYNYWGLFLAALKICFKRQNCFYCSEFVRDMLIQFNIFNEKQFDKIIHPTSFLKLNGTDIIYTGRLNRFAEFKDAYENEPAEGTA